MSMLKKLTPKKPLIKKADPVEDMEDDMEDDTPPAPVKKVIGKKPIAKKAAPVVEDDEDSEDDLEEDMEDDSEDDTPPAPVKKAAAKKATSTKETAATEKPTKWGKKDAIVNKKELEPGAWMPQNQFIDILHQNLTEAGVGVPDKATTSKINHIFQATVTDILQQYRLKLFGVTSTRSNIQERIFKPNTELESVSTPYVTLVEPYVKSAITLNIGKVSRKGRINNSGEFEEGQYDAKGVKFTAGTWDGDDFTPATAKKTTKR